MPWGKHIKSHFHVWVNYPFNDYKGVILEYFHTHTDLIYFFYQIALTALKYETPKFLWFRTQKRTHAYSKTVLFPIWVYVYALFFKGIVHPKMKIMSSFTHPVVSNLYECVCSAEHKGRYSEECGKQSSSEATLTSIIFFFLLWKSMVPQNSLLTNFLQSIFLCVRQNKDIHTGLELLESEFIFG